MPGACTPDLSVNALVTGEECMNTFVAALEIDVALVESAIRYGDNRDRFRNWSLVCQAGCYQSRNVGLGAAAYFTGACMERVLRPPFKNVKNMSS